MVDGLSIEDQKTYIQEEGYRSLISVIMYFFRAFKRKRYHIAVTVVGLILVYFICLYNNLVPDELNIFISLEYQQLEEGKETTEFTDSKCVLPQLDPFRKEVMPLIKTLPPLKCKEKRYGVVNGQEIHLNPKGLKKAKLVYIRRPPGDDFTVKYSDPVDINLNEKDSNGNVIIKPKEELLKLVLDEDSGSTIHELHGLILPRPDVLKTAKRLDASNGNDLGLNVALIMVESLSAAMFERSLPQTKKVLNNFEDSLYFKGHTIVGDGTTAQLCAILTGLNEQQLPEARVSYSNSKSVDSWPFIFKDFAKQGYVTMFLEDAPKYASFNYRLKGFVEAPTHHYSRPLFLCAEKTNDYGNCFGNWAAHNHSIAYTKFFFDQYKDFKKFSLTTFARLSHNNLNRVQLMDTDFSKFLLHLNKMGHLNTTMLIIFGDHGPRMSGARSSIAGKIEERQAFLSIVLPSWFKTKHRTAYDAMLKNTNIMTSHFDLYGTIKYVLTHPQMPEVSTGQSLFHPIDSEKRNCRTAGVADHWCPCLGYTNMSIDDPLVQALAVKGVHFINELVAASEVPLAKCMQLELGNLIRAGKLGHNWKMESFRKTKQNSRCDTCMIVFNREKKKSPVTYELVFTVKPSGGMYELNVKVDGERILVDPNISRINRYGDQPKCIAAQFPHLRKYCFCKEQ